MARERWGSQLGLILAMAGNAVGLGNFLRFPVQAAANGGGAFMVPYFAAFLLLGIPLMWAEWAMGRYGGKTGTGTMPGIFHVMWKHPAAKYLGVLGVVLPFFIGVFYLFIESWTLAYTYFSATGRYFGNLSRTSMSEFLKGYQGVESNSYFSGFELALFFFAITFLINFYVLYRGVTKGIEMLARYAMPLLFFFALILMIRVLTLGSPTGNPDWSATSGMAFIWNPDFSQLSQSRIWLAAAGQIFFTLSLASGLIQAYASYMKQDDDIVASGLATSSCNGFCEVIFGGSIAIPAAVAFFGIEATRHIAESGAFDLGFVSLPVVFQQIPLGQFFGAIWFFLLFLAGVTSSVALVSPAITFLQDEFHLSRQKAVSITGAATLFCGSFVLFFFKYGFLDEMDYWAGTFGLVVFAVIEVIIFAWIFGMDRAWEEMHKGASIRIPRFFYFVLKYVTPAYLIILLAVWTKQEAISVFRMDGVPEAHRPYHWAARILMLSVTTLVILLVRKAFRNRPQEPASITAPQTEP